MLDEGVRAALDYLGIASRTVAYAEWEAPAASQLVALMEAGALEPAPVWCGDFRRLRAADWRGKVDCITAGFPCQDISIAGKRAGLDGKRSGLFFDILDIADDCGAWCLALENVSAIATAAASVVDEAEGELEERAAARVVGELADRGWDAEWITLSASDVGASHGRARWFCFAWRRMGHPGLQHQHLQQREDGAEHPGAGQPVAHADRAERGPKCSCGTGCIEGHEGRPKPGREQGRPDAAECGCAVADTKHLRRSERRDTGSVHRSETENAGDCECHHGPQSESPAVADASQPRLPDAEQRTAGRAGGGHEGGATAEFRGAPFLFAPGPADPRWAGIIAGFPWFSPALSIEGQHDAEAAFRKAQPLLRGVAHGLADGLDFSSRSHRLRQIGNGVVPAQAAAAFVVLVRRAGIFTLKEQA